MQGLLRAHPVEGGALQVFPSQSLEGLEVSHHQAASLRPAASLVAAAQHPSYVVARWTLSQDQVGREAALQDGRFLTAAGRFDLLDEKLREEAKLVRVSERFRVIAIGLPVPPFPGFPLDPPLRSRFVARRMEPMMRTYLSAANSIVVPFNECQSNEGVLIDPRDSGQPGFRGEKSPKKNTQW